ncbi:hypothetical protein Bca101_087736 [Brassica carinata]
MHLPSLKGGGSLSIKRLAFIPKTSSSEILNHRFYSLLPPPICDCSGFGKKET